MTSRDTVLIVDDEPIIYNLLGKILSKLGYDSLAASNLQEARELMTAHQDEISIAIIDLILPEADGRVVLTTLREIKPKLVTLLSSGRSAKDIKAISEASGADGYLSKPYRVDQLATVIETAVEKRKQVDQEVSTGD